MTAAFPQAARPATAYRVLLEDAFGNLSVQPTKSLLALIGTAMGTAAVIALLHIGSNARAEALRRFKEVGSDFVTIMPPVGSASKVPISFEDVLEMPLGEMGLKSSVPLIQSTVRMPEGRDTSRVSFVGTTSSLLPLLHLTISRGRFVSEYDELEPFVVIGSEIAARIAALRAQSVTLGDHIRIDAEIYRVIGVLKSQPLNPLTGLDPNKTVFANIKATRRLVNPPDISSIAARMAPGATEQAVTSGIKKYFRRRLEGADVQVLVASALIANIDQQMQIYGTLLLAIGSVSLAIGGIGIMNVMLMAVMERREEIGLRAAVGASPTAIRIMFLMESICLASLGAAAGLLLGVVVGWIFSVRSGWSFEFSEAALPLGLGMALTVGLFFGIYPAHRAASLDPIEALRRQ
jgi:putative ABC transport system permease protein